jgi:integrase/recombinase XerC
VELAIKHLTIDQWSHLIGRASDQRDYLVLSILYETGCTVFELVNIQYQDIDFERTRLKIHDESARNGEPRWAFISGSLLTRIKSYRKANPDSPYLLYTRQSSQITTKRIRQIVKSLFKSCQIKAAGPQVIRYTHIVHAYEKGIPLDAIKRQVGLKRSRAIEIFSELPEHSVQDAYRRFKE